MNNITLVQVVENAQDLADDLPSSYFRQAAFDAVLSVAIDLFSDERVKLSALV